MKTNHRTHRADFAGFTLLEIMISMTIVVLVLGMAMNTFLFGLRMMYKDGQRLASNASLRTFMSQISNETLNASYYYLFPYYTSLDGSVSLTGDTVTPTQQGTDNTNDLFDQWIAHGDCLVLVTLTSQYRVTDIKQIRIYYRLTKDQSTTAGQNLNAEAALRYYETDDWGEDDGTSAHGPNGHPVSGLATALNAINLNTTPTITRSKQITSRSLGRFKLSPATDRYPIFSSFSSMPGRTSGSISINVEFVNGTGANNQLSSSSFNYTVSPRN